MLADPSAYPYYIRTSGVSAAVLPSVAGPGRLVFDHGDSVAYLMDSATAGDLDRLAQKLTVLGGKLELMLKKLPE